jgi:alkaline phosphatase D
MVFNESVTRRRFLKSAGLLISAAALPWDAAYPVYAAAAAGPQLDQGIQIGDVQAHQAVIWSRSDRPARLLVEYDFSESFSDPIRVRGPFALETTDFTARVDLTGLPADHKIFVRVMFQDLSNDRNLSEAVEGAFRTAPHREKIAPSDSCGAATPPTRAGVSTRTSAE